MKAKVNRVTIHILQGDLLASDCAVVVQETNHDLNLSPALIDRAGLSVRREALARGYCDVGSAVMIGAGDLPAHALLLAVGPRWGEGSERGKLANVTYDCLSLAEANGMKSIGFPAISTGVLGYPLENCARTMLTQVIDYSFEPLKSLRHVKFIMAEDLFVQAFTNELADQLSTLREDSTANGPG